MVSLIVNRTAAKFQKKHIGLDKETESGPELVHSALDLTDSGDEL